MLVLFDQATPAPLRAYLKGHVVRTAAQEGWDRLRNGELLLAAEAKGFDAFITTDKNLRYQQNLRDRRIAIIVLGQGQWPAIRTHADRILAAVEAAAQGGYMEVEIPLG